MQEIKTVDAVGHILCHDITEIVKDVKKGVRFKKGHVVTAEDIPVLLDLGKEHLYVWEQQPGYIHEDEAAAILASLCINDHMSSTKPSEGKIDIVAEADGLLIVDQYRLMEINMTNDMMMATKFSYDPVTKGEKIAGTRVIPLVIEQQKLDDLKTQVGENPILEIIPYKNMSVGIVTTGSEVLTGRIKDAFTPVLKAKVEKYGSKVDFTAMPGDDKASITKAINDMKAKGADIILCSGGMSIDPDDRTPGAISDSVCEVITYGSPVLPGAMFMLGYFDDDTPVVGIPGCAMFNDTTVLDIILPRLLAGIKVSKREIAALGHGGLCNKCSVCHWPICYLGKGRA